MHLLLLWHFTRCEQVALCGPKEVSWGKNCLIDTLLPLLPGPCKSMLPPACACDTEFCLKLLADPGNCSYLRYHSLSFFMHNE